MTLLQHNHLLDPFCLKPNSMRKILPLVTCLLVGMTSLQSASAGVVAHWRFEEGPAGANVDRGGEADGVFYPGVADSSGNGNALSAWSDGGYAGHAYRTDVPSSTFPQGSDTNQFSVQNTGDFPAMFTSSSAPIRTITPAQWTIEASYKPQDTQGSTPYRTVVGRDSLGANTAGSLPNAAVSALYFQLVPGDGVAIKFCDVSGYWHEAISASGLVQSFPSGNPGLGHWYHMAAVCDGSTLSVYLNDVEAGGGYQLVAQTDLTLSGSPNTALTAGMGSDFDWVAGSWTVGRGLYNGGHTDRARGFIDEVRISDEALSPNEFLFATPLQITDVGLIPNEGNDLFRLSWNSRAGAYYRVTSKSDLHDETWVPQAVGIPATPPVNNWTSTVQNVQSEFFRVESEIVPRTLDINPAVVLNGIDENVYGHFLEHIYHSANGGLWGDLVWNRSFELNNGTSGGIWTIEGSDLVQSSLSTDVHLEFGDTAWTDYELTLEAQKESGSEGFLIVFRAVDENNFYWLNLGGWGNTLHAIQKEVNGSISLVSSQVSGSINAGQWYDIRIRCEGNRFQCWLDSTLVFDITDNSSPFLSGRVGVGTWSTRARYRNIVVTDLATSNTLYSGLPTPPPSEFVSDFWSVHGTGTVSLTSDALNNDLAVELTGSGSETGLQQDNFKFIPQVYSGSLWMKGDLPDGLKIEFLDGSNTIAQTTLSAPTTGWAEYPFALTPTSSTDDGSMRISLLGSGTVTLDQVSMMGQDAIDTGGYRPDLLAAVDDLHAPIIRWPGGCFASLYLWKDAIGPQHERRIYPAYMWEDQDINSYGTDEFLRMCEITGTEPLLVINTGILDSSCGAPAQFKLNSPADYLPYALDWMEYCNGDTNTTWGAVRAANGHPAPYNVTYWEIDNETWCGDCGGGIANYIAAVQEFAPALRAKAAELGVPIKLSAVGSGGYDQSWNQSILDACATNIDYISVHYYENPGNFADAPLWYEDYIIDLAGRIAASDNPDVEIYNSEWNAQSTDLRTGLFAGGLLNVYERQGDVFTLGGPALFLRHTSAGDWDNAFINFDHTGWFPAPNYVVMKLWRDHYAPWRIQVNGDAGALNLVATKSDDGGTVNVKVINPDPVEQHVYLNLPGGTTITDATFQYVTAASLYTHNSLSEPNAVQAVTGIATVTGPGVGVTLPPYSASVVSISLP